MTLLEAIKKANENQHLIGTTDDAGLIVDVAPLPSRDDAKNEFWRIYRLNRIHKHKEVEKVLLYPFDKYSDYQVFKIYESPMENLLLRGLLE
jgi:hypothetical protein